VGKLIYSMSVSLDGFVESTSRSLDWAQVDEELHTFFNSGQTRKPGNGHPHSPPVAERHLEVRPPDLHVGRSHRASR